MQPNKSMLTMVLLATLCIGGCGSQQEEEPRRPLGQNNVFGDTVATKDRASEGVDRAMEQRREELEQAMKKQDQEAGAQ